MIKHLLPLILACASPILGAGANASASASASSTASAEADNKRAHQPKSQYVPQSKYMERWATCDAVRRFQQQELPQTFEGLAEKLDVELRLVAEFDRKIVSAQAELSPAERMQMFQAVAAIPLYLYKIFEVPIIRNGKPVPRQDFTPEIFKAVQGRVATIAGKFVPFSDRMAEAIFLICASDEDMSVRLLRAIESSLVSKRRDSKLPQLSQDIWTVVNDYLRGFSVGAYKDLISPGETQLHMPSHYISDTTGLGEFQNIENIRSLWMSGNAADRGALSAISSDDFTNLKKLSALRLNRNHLADFPIQILSVCPDLSFIDLSENDIQTLSEEFYKHVLQSKNPIILLHDNPLTSETKERLKKLKADGWRVTFDDKPATTGNNSDQPPKG